MWNRLGALVMGLLCILALVVFFGPVWASLLTMAALLIARGPELWRARHRDRRWHALDDDDSNGFPPTPDAGSRVPVAPRRPTRTGRSAQELPLER